MLTQRALRSDAVAFGEGAQRARAERRVFSGAHARSVTGPERVRSRAEGPGPNVKGGAGCCPDAVSEGHDPHGRKELPGRIRGRRALAHLPRTREPARTRPRMSRRRRRKPRSRRGGPCASNQAPPLRSPTSPPHLGDDRSMTTSHAESADAAESSSQRRASSVPLSPRTRYPNGTRATSEAVVENAR